MKIGTNYNPPSKIAFSSKGKEGVAHDKVVLGGNATDNTLAMGDQLRSMKADGDACDKALNDTIKTAGIGLLGSIAGGIGGKFLASSLGACGFGTFAAITAGVLVGGFIGLEIGAHKTGLGD